jgi:Kef-type K+ transport system membrane component KefB
MRSIGVGSSSPHTSGQAWDAIRQFSLAFFIPIYFFTVGLKLDLIHNFHILFFLCFLVLSCALKAGSIWFGAKLAGQPSGRAWDLAVALNARGGPGIVLATVTFEAAIVNESFFTSLVLLSVLTSQLAGYWLDRRSAALVTDAMPAMVTTTPEAPKT